MEQERKADERAGMEWWNGLDELTMQPTPQAYAELQQAYEHFNVALFYGKLPDCLITLQRERRTYGHFFKHPLRQP